MCTSAQTGKPRDGFMTGTRRVKAASGRPGSGPRADFHVGTCVSEMMETSSANCLPALPSDVLIVEDDPLIALDFEDTIGGLGVKRVRSAGNVARALEMIADRAPDFALLDVALVRENSFAVAERLEALQIPFVFITGYGAEVGLPAAFARQPRLPKPCPTDALQAVLKHRSYAGARRDA
jgi:CheY-like chemotaxis protein